MKAVFSQTKKLVIRYFHSLKTRQFSTFMLFAELSDHLRGPRFYCFKPSILSDHTSDTQLISPLEKYLMGLGRYPCWFDLLISSI